MTFAANQTSLSLLWGSVDDYNVVEFWDDEVQIGSITGSDVTTTVGLGAAFVSITGVSFDEVRFGSDTNAFEFSSVSAVPIPAAAWLFASALLGLVTIARRKVFCAWGLLRFYSISNHNNNLR